jgi:hypothetical protein
MSLHGAGLSDSRHLKRQLAPTSGHHAYCRAIVVTFDIRALRNSFVLGSYSLFGIGTARALSSGSEAAGIWWPRRTPQSTITGN